MRLIRSRAILIRVWYSSICVAYMLYGAVHCLSFSKPFRMHRVFRAQIRVIMVGDVLELGVYCLHMFSKSSSTPDTESNYT